MEIVLAAILRLLSSSKQRACNGFWISSEILEMKLVEIVALGSSYSIRLKFELKLFVLWLDSP